MGSSFTRIFHEFAGRVAMKTENRDKLKKDNLWRENPEIRKLVPVPKCPHCKCRLYGDMYEDSDTDVELEIRHKKTDNLSTTDSKDVQQNYVYDDAADVLKSEGTICDALSEESSELDLNFEANDILPKTEVKPQATGEVLEGAACF